MKTPLLSRGLLLMGSRWSNFGEGATWQVFQQTWRLLLIVKYVRRIALRLPSYTPGKKKRFIGKSFLTLSPTPPPQPPNPPTPQPPHHLETREELEPIISRGIHMRIALFCIMAERTKHIHAQRPFRFSAEPHKTLSNRTLRNDA